MIGYNPYTLQQLFDEVIIRCGQHRTPENMDWFTTVSYINQAFEEAMMHTVPLKEWAYVSTLEVTHLQALDINFIEPIRVMLSVDGLPPFIEARRIDVREWYTIQNPTQYQRWNKSNYNNPTYMIWGQILYLHPNTTWGDTLADQGNVSGIMDCYQIPARKYLPTDVFQLPYEYEELIILTAIEKIIGRTVDNTVLEDLTKAVQIERTKVIEQYTKRQRSKKRSLESFVEPVTPLIPPVQEPGELPNKII